MMTHISVDMHLEAGNDRVWGNAQSMRQVLLNLMLNAVDALQSQNIRSGDGHHIAISTRNEDVAAAQCLVIEDSPTGVQAALAAGMACIAVSTPFTRKALHASGMLEEQWIVDDPTTLVMVVNRMMAEKRGDNGSGAEDDCA